MGECFFWYQLTRVVPDKNPESHKMVVVVVVLFLQTDAHFTILFVQGNYDKEYTEFSKPYKEVPPK